MPSAIAPPTQDVMLGGRGYVSVTPESSFFPLQTTTARWKFDIEHLAQNLDNMFASNGNVRQVPPD